MAAREEKEEGEEAKKGEKKAKQTELRLDRAPTAQRALKRPSSVAVLLPRSSGRARWEEGGGVIRIGAPVSRASSYCAPTKQGIEEEEESSRPMQPGGPTPIPRKELKYGRRGRLHCGRERGSSSS